jgi:hypothetical protein
MSSAFRIALLLGLVASAACRKADYGKCQTAVKNFATLQFWSTVEAEIAAAPAESRPALRAQKVAELEQKLAAGIDMAISQCQAANNDDQIACMTKATTWAEARKCAEAW